jgi:hypothetical protein
MTHVFGDTSNGPPAIKGTNGAGAAGTGVEGVGNDGIGVHGHSTTGRGVVAHSDKDYGLRADSVDLAGMRASSVNGRGAEGWSTSHEGLVGVSTSGSGVLGTSTTGIGVVGESASNEGVRGVSHNAHGAVVGINDFTPAPGSAPPGTGGNGAWFESSRGEGVRGVSDNKEHGGVVGVNTAAGVGVFGTSDQGQGIWGTSTANEGIHAESHSPVTAAIAAYQTNPDSTGAALYAKHNGNRVAGVFIGDVVITGHIEFAAGDCAEQFAVTGGDAAMEEAVAPGTVMVIDSSSALRPSAMAYDRRVAGVVSGAGGFRPGIVLDKHDGPEARCPIALAGKVYCHVDADHASIEVGDLLTTSPTSGHAMKATDVSRAFGAVLGKALEPLTAGRALLPILVALT